MIREVVEMGTTKVLVKGWGLGQLLRGLGRDGSLSAGRAGMGQLLLYSGYNVYIVHTVNAYCVVCRQIGRRFG